MLIRGVAAWCGLLAMAVVNGAVREAWIIPATGELAGHAISTITLCAGILVYAWLTTAWMQPETRRDAAQIGAVWLALTLAFEFLAGHYLFGNPWERLLADYQVLEGRIWVLVLITTAMAPTVGMWRQVASTGRERDMR